MTPQEFNDIYWASFPAAVRELRHMAVDAWIAPQADDKPPGRLARATDLAGEGHTLDLDIHVCGREPYQTMIVPAFLGATRIRTSIDPAQYPAYDKPSPQPVMPVVGFQLYGNRYAAGPGDSRNFANGSETTQDGVKYRKHAQESPFGQFGVYWERI
jgi:hypothetical protein